MTTLLNGYGEGQYSYGGYGGALDVDNIDAYRDALTDSTLRYREDTNLARLIRVLVIELDFLSLAIQNIAQAHTIVDASGAVLDKYGALFGAERTENESDEHYRLRLQARGLVSHGSGTFNELAELTKLLLQTDYSNVSFPIDLAADPATFKAETSSSVVSDSPFTASEVEGLLQDAVAAGHTATLTVV